ncbi:DUF1656 domain-containing protein [Kushneria phosphatilytica]|uniref:DUF1656 domain-containing protein n=1 Tax=Kushneria phosphatilytica TaxID=657387 RepID=A0A1S1NP57_9GAMM|nr:DUF1656 domain-containing protein [Kushneria phosphatilytica]OHV09703.1 hypothetical protein BH688_10700 [Kushneria phosphatilytica]QEL11749.1 DUF1656 domain-containing protein [Kushneria phosphatilytica]
MLHEMSLGGIFYSPMLIFVLISLVVAALLRTLIHKSVLSRLVWQEAWFDVSLFVCVLAVVTYVLTTME